MTSNTAKSSKEGRPGKGVRPPRTSSTTLQGSRTRRVLRSSEHSSAASVSSTTAKASFRELMQKAKRGPVFVTVHKKREAVVMSTDAYEQLLANQRDPLANMAQHFDALVAKMQTSEHAAAVDALFSATPKALGAAAVQAAKRG